MNPATAKAVKVGGAIVVLVVAVVIYASSGGGPQRERDTKTIHGVSLATGKEYVLNVPVLETEPYTDPDTGERCVYPWYISKEAHKRFVPELEPRPDGPPKVPMMPRCPETGSLDVTGWFPELEEIPEFRCDGDMPLPEWPYKPK